MAISLNSVNTRLTTVENNGNIITAQSGKAQNWYVKYKNGLIMQGGYKSMSSGTNRTETFTLNTAFTTTTYVAISQCNFAYEEERGGWGLANVVSRTTSSFNVKKAFGEACTVHWIAIGYLISYRILNYAYAYIKSLRDFKAIIKSHSFCKLLSKISREVI